jgi:hypothetical protein
MVMQTCNPSTQEAETGGSWVQGQPGLYNETLSQQNKTKQKSIQEFRVIVTSSDD